METGIGAVVLAAGRSRRMGQPKALLPWGSLTVIESIVHTLAQAGVDDIVVVANPGLAALCERLDSGPGRVILNQDYIEGGMVSSAKVGLGALSPETGAALIVLGDQPHIGPEIPAEIIHVYRARERALVVPSFSRRRGHPWLVSRRLWPEIFMLPENATLRDFLDAHAQDIEYVTVHTDAVLTDLDTPADYQALKPD